MYFLWGLHKGSQSKSGKDTYFAMFNAHFFAQTFEGEIRMCTIHGCNDYIL